jgi:ribosome-associated translation inhibitor RaiA
MNQNYQVTHFQHSNSTYGSKSVQNPLDDALRRIAALDNENVRLRQQVFDANQKHEDLNALLITVEGELKYEVKKEKEKFEKELSVKVYSHTVISRYIFIA